MSTAVDGGNRYREVTVYDFKWNAARSVIETAAKWVGWYLDQSGSWSGEGTGLIRLEAEKLVTTRSYKSTFGSGEELCEYFRK